MVQKRTSRRWQARIGDIDRVSSKEFNKKAVIYETDIQQDLINELRLCKKTYKGKPLIDFIYAIPNGGYRGFKIGKQLKAEGVKPGIPDLHLFIASNQYHSLYIEMKTEVGGLSPDQKKVIPILRSEGHKVVVCRSALQAQNEIFKYLGWI